MCYTICFVPLVAAAVDTNPMFFWEDGRIVFRGAQGIAASRGSNIGTSGNDQTLGDYPYLPPPPPPPPGNNGGIQGSSGANFGASGNDPTLGDYPYLPPSPPPPPGNNVQSGIKAASGVNVGTIGKELFLPPAYPPTPTPPMPIIVYNQQATATTKSPVMTDPFCKYCLRSKGPWCSSLFCKVKSVAPSPPWPWHGLKRPWHVIGKPW